MTLWVNLDVHKWLDILLLLVISIYVNINYMCGFDFIGIEDRWIVRFKKVFF